MFVRLDRAEDRFRAAYIAYRPDGSAVVYPDGLLGRGYLLSQLQLETYLAERDRRLQPVIGRQKRYGILAWLGFGLLAVGLLVSGTEFVLLAAMLAAIPMLLAALVWTRRRTVKKFATLFPGAPRAVDAARYRRWTLAMLMSPGFAVWRCTTIASVALVVLASAMLGLVSGETPHELAIAALSGAIALWLIAQYGYLLAQHIRFRLRHHRAPRADDLKALQADYG